MRRLAAVLPCAILAVPAAAQAAQVRTDRSCYLQTPKTTVSVTGSGFSPGAPFAVALDGTTLEGGSGAIDAAGGMQGAFNPPMLGDSRDERRFHVSVTAGGATAATTFTLTRFVAGFTPATGDPTTLRVRFSVHGFGLAQANPDVFLHYVDPLRRLRKTIRLGRAQGQCGSIARTAERRLFPFANPRGGRWQLQFDTSRRFERRTKGSGVLFFTVGVTIRHHAARA